MIELIRLRTSKTSSLHWTVRWIFMVSVLTFQAGLYIRELV